MHLHPSGLIQIACGVYALLLAYRIIPVNRRNPERAELWHRKFGKLMKILGPFLIVLGFIELIGVLGDESSYHKKYNSPFAAEFAAAVDQFNKSPPGLQRANDFISRLKTIETETGVPPDLKQALGDYVSASEDGIAAMKAGQDITTYNQRMADSKKRIQACLAR